MAVVEVVEGEDGNATFWRDTVQSAECGVQRERAGKPSYVQDLLMRIVDLIDSGELQWCVPGSCHYWR